MEFRMILFENDMLLMLDYGIFYEFIPADKISLTILLSAQWEK